MGVCKILMILLRPPCFINNDAVDFYSLNIVNKMANILQNVFPWMKKFILSLKFQLLPNETVSSVKYIQNTDHTSTEKIWKLLGFLFCFSLENQMPL